MSHVSDRARPRPSEAGRVGPTPAVARRSASLVPLLAVLLSLAVAATACENDDGPSGLGFVDGGGSSPSDTSSPPPDTSTDGPDAVADTRVPPDVPVDAGPVCFAPPGTVLPVAAGLLSSYSRGAYYPSIRQWADRARALEYRGLLFADAQRRTTNATRIEQFSDANPDYAFQFVYLWDKVFEFRQQGDGALATSVESYPGLELLGGSAIRLRGVADGSARAIHEPDPAFDYDIQDVVLHLRIAIPERNQDARVTLTYEFNVGAADHRLTWVFFGDVGEDWYIEDVFPEKRPGPTFRAYDLPVKEHVVERLGPNVWTEGRLTKLELRVDGAADVVFDDVRLNVDAWFADYLEETDKYTLGSPATLVPGVEHYFDSGLGQFTCLAPTSFPASEADPSDGLFADFAAAGCAVTVADRPWAPGAGADAAYVRQADVVEVWHPSHPGDGLALDRWDELLLDGAPMPGIASAFARDIRDLQTTTPHNHVLAASANPEDILAAVAAGRLYMTDGIDVRVSFWAERPDCRRAEMGETVSDAVALHATVACPDGLAEAKLVRPDVVGDTAEVVLEDAAEEAIVPLDLWPAGHVRLEATCQGGARIVTNPIRLTD